ncbi:redoxin domain-containing protein [Methanocalculus sp.]|uniref:redoxin domain-containing protein n=1 Tax=Methanocalculus sp. TaxID=2004547 RepID=UPI0026039F4A|nr:redoxin domain-containing protein [Methanocalculus sp.]MDG6251523.1 redoxin domain-containing protein [Methanocalculus sp.]
MIPDCRYYVNNGKNNGGVVSIVDSLIYGCKVSYPLPAMLIISCDNARAMYHHAQIPQPRMVRPGDLAATFALKDQSDETFSLLEHHKRRVLLSFHPLAWTDKCAAQMLSLEENRETFSSLNTVAVGISVDSVPCKRAWAKSLRIANTPLLCDFWPHGFVSRLYGLFREGNGFCERANVIVDSDQAVVFSKVYPVHSVPDISEIIGFLESD